MDLSSPSPSNEDYRYCSLQFAETDVFVGDDEPSRFIHHVQGKIAISLEDDARRLVIGNFAAVVVDVESAINEGVSPFDVFDSEGKTAPYYRALFRQQSWSGADFRKPVLQAIYGDDEPWRPNLLILDRVTVFPEHRGRKAGLLAIHICFSAGNLKRMATAGVVVADNDETKTGETVAQATGLPYFLPPPGDLNDMHKAQGVFRTSQALRKWLTSMQTRQEVCQ